MRRAQSMRHTARPSMPVIVDDLGALSEQPEETAEETLRRQLLAAERENDKVCMLHSESIDLSWIF